MTALAADTGRQQSGPGPMPGKLKAYMKAGETFYKGSMIVTDTTTGYDVVASAATTQVPRGVYLGDQITNSGASGSVVVDIYPGIWRFANGGDITIAHRGQKCYFQDDNTVYLAQNGTRSEAGIIDDVTADGVWVVTGPYPVPGATYVTLTGAQTLTNKTLTAPTIASAANMAWYTGHKGVIEIPLGDICDADGDRAKFANAGADGMTITDSKAVCYRINNAGPAPKNICGFGIPADADVTAAMTLKFMCSKSGATVGDATTIAVEAFNQVNGALYDADADFGGTTDALVGDAIAKTIDVLSLSLAAVNLPAAGSKVSLTFTPTNGTLGTDDLLIHRIWVEYTKLAV